MEPFNQANNDFEIFVKQWKIILKNINVQFITWEDILNEINDQDIDRFYESARNAINNGSRIIQHVRLTPLAQISVSPKLRICWKHRPPLLFSTLFLWARCTANACF
jgi:hypothetical protein